MRNVREGWKSMRREAKILLVVSMIISFIFGASFMAMLVLSDGSSVSEETLNTINTVVICSALAGFGCLCAFVIDGHRKHAAKAVMIIEDVDSASDEEVMAEVVQPPVPDGRWKPNPEVQRDREIAWRRE